MRGRVQGVGFRPHVYRLAVEMQLAGFVGNSPAGAFIEIEAAAAQINRFRERLLVELPPLAEISALEEAELSPNGKPGFDILPSEHEGEQRAEITPDSATCGDCLREMSDPTDRRYRYPFINCTNCGPRYSIVQSIPYDRRNTTMSAFVMCPDCQGEYDDPLDRRFHAQPNACPVCGPHIWLTDNQGEQVAGDAVRLAASWLAAGKIVAIKGLGGFHLACRADEDEPVATLRRRKSREAKPLAMMAGSLNAVREIVELDAASEAALASPARPIVLAPKRVDAKISPHVAHGSETFGVMLPYTPLHELLFAEGLPPLVMTSGNPSAEPLCRENDEAINRLGHIADGFLLHNRDIERGIDDSVVMAVPFSLIPLRRARGFVPAPIRVRINTDKPILATGGELKSTVCLMSDGEAVVSEHLGDLTNPAAYRNFVAAIDCFQKLLDLKPAVVACDMHPEYAATRYARQLGLPLTEVQHHHAHVVACMAENGVTGEVIGLACDGTGYGTDGTIWGCEVFLADEADFRRVGHLKAFPSPGGDAAAIETWRPAAGVLHETWGGQWPASVEAAMRRVDPEAVATARSRMASASARIVRTSSLGRFFDAVAFLLGVCDRNRCEAEAPMALEAIAATATESRPLEWSLNIDEDGVVEMDFRPMIRQLLETAGDRSAIAALARGFHDSLADMLAACVGRVVETHGNRPVMLTGGCMANRFLLRRLWDLLRTAGLEVYIHRLLPPGDGGISLGQAVCAAEKLKRGTF